MFGIAGNSLLNGLPLVSQDTCFSGFGTLPVSPEYRPEHQAGCSGRLEGSLG
jgi:hypothetical protein